MKHYQIVNIQEILSQKDGVAYKGEIGVFVSNDAKDFYLSGNTPVYVNAFSYALIISGKASLSIDENIFKLSQNMLCILSPLHLTYFFEFSSDFKCVFLCLHKDFIDKIGTFNLKQRIATGMNTHSNPIIEILPQEKDILETSIEHISRQITRTEHQYHLEIIQNSLIRFYLELDNILDRKDIQTEKTDKSITSIPRNRIKLQEFMTLLMNNFKEEHNVSFYAKSMNITPQYLTKIIKSQTGKTVNAFIFELIYSEARNLLGSTDLSIQQITCKLNFADQASFSKFFKRHSGISPQIFRESYFTSKEPET